MFPTDLSTQEASTESPKIGIGLPHKVIRNIKHVESWHELLDKMYILPSFIWVLTYIDLSGKLFELNEHGV